MKSYRYTVVDVFTTEALEGNALAVFPDASDLDEGTMQKIARELNLAETAFVLPATRKDFVARLRVFTPARELAFAGIPRLALRSCCYKRKLSCEAAVRSFWKCRQVLFRFELKEAGA